MHFVRMHKLFVQRHQYISEGELLEMNAKNYPSSITVLELLGDTYLQSNDLKLALASYEKAISIDKNNEAIKQKIKKIRN